MATGQIVLSSGDPAPGLITAIQVADPFDPAVIDLDGNIAFRARLDAAAVGGPFEERVLVYGRTNGDLAVVVRGNDPEPSGTLPGVVIATFLGVGIPNGNALGSNVRLSPFGGLLMFGAGLAGPGVVRDVVGRNDSCIYMGTPGALQILVRRGDPAPGGTTIDTDFADPSNQSTALNSSGTAVFRVRLSGGNVTGPNDDDAWMIGAPGALQFLAREGELLTGGLVGFGSLGFRCLMNELGLAVHDERLSTTLGATPATPADDEVLCVYFPGGVNLIAQREGDPVQGLAGVRFAGGATLGASLAANGDFCFHSRLAGPSVTTANDTAVFISNFGGAHSMRAREGDPIPALPGHSLGVINTSSLSGNSRGVAFVGFLKAGPSVNTDNDACVLFATAAGIEKIAREGDPAPGFPPGHVIGSTGGSGIVGGASNPLINELGQILFACTVVDRATANNYAAFYAYEPGRGLRLLVAGGDTYATGVGPQPVSLVGASWEESGDGAPLALNNHGDFVVRVFLGGPQAIVRGHLGALHASPSAVPITGGSQSMNLDAGIANAGMTYFIAGTTAGTRPGLHLTPQVFLPLNVDPWLSVSFGARDPVYPANIGVLDSQGRASTAMNIPPGYPQFAGTNFHHAFGVVTPSGIVRLISEPASLLLY